MAITALFLAVGPEEGAARKFVTIHVDTGNRVFDSELTLQGNANALDALRSEHDVETETSTFGDYITCIEGVCQSAGEAWFFYVNDEMAQVGAGGFVPDDGDNIAFLLRNY